MQTADALVQILRAEGVEQSFCYPFSPIMDAMARAGVKPIVTRQERVAGNMADGVSRSTNGDKMGVVTVQALAGSENAFAGIAHAHTDSTPVLFLPGHPGTRFVGTDPTFDSMRNYRGVTKWSQTLLVADQLQAQMRRAFTALRTGRPRPAMLELPADVCRSEYNGEIDWTPVPPMRSAPDQGAVEEAADRLLAAETPLIWAGSGVLYAKASDELTAVAELLGAPVMTTLQGKSAIPESHPLAAGVGALVATAMVPHYLGKSDTLLAVGSSLSVAPFTRVIPEGKTIIHVTVDPVDINKDYPAAVGVISDAKLFLAALAGELRRRLGSRGRADVRAATEEELARIKSEWLAEFEPLFTDDSAPINGYRMFRELWDAVDPDTTMITHEAGASRDIQCVFYQSSVPRSYLGWGQSSQLGFSLGLAMGAKLANPEKLVVNVMGDGAVGMTAMDLETAARNNIGTLTVIKHDSVFSGYDRNIPDSIARYNAAEQTGDYAAMATALGCHAERVEEPSALAAAFARAITATREGQPAVVDVITAETRKLSHHK